MDSIATDVPGRKAAANAGVLSGGEYDESLRKFMEVFKGVLNEEHSIHSFSMQVAEMKNLPAYDTLGLKDVDVTAEQVRRRVEHIQKGDNPMVFEKVPKRRRLEVEL